MTEENKTSFHSVLPTGQSQRVLCCIVCNVFVKRVCLHTLFLYVICVMSILKACCMLFHVSHHLLFTIYMIFYAITLCFIMFI